MRTITKVLTVAAIVALYAATSLLLAVTAVNARTRRLRLMKNAVRFAGPALSALGVCMSVRHGDRLREKKGGRLIVANHVSSVDILILASLTPSVFVTSVELRNAFFVGLMARLGGSVFVERRRVTGLKREIEEIAGALREGLTIALFPEGTTSNGDAVRPFKNSLFDAAVRAGAEVLPVCIRYRRVDGRDVDARNRDAVYFYGGTNFFVHVFRLLSLRRIDVDVNVLEPLGVRAHESRKRLAALSHREISAAYGR